MPAWLARTTTKKLEIPKEDWEGVDPRHLTSPETGQQKNRRKKVLPTKKAPFVRDNHFG
ncbi:hypothetical protein KKB40_03830 [Patescibacteria group bacterium]|nr:hypothetical protein [Patescibacteria group bacterium]